MFPITIDANLETKIANENKKVFQLGKSIAFNYDTRSFLLGRALTDEEKVRQWLTLLVNTRPNNEEHFGIDVAELIGLRNVPKGFIASEFKRELSDACKLCPLIESVDGFSFERSGTELSISFTVKLYNETESEVLLYV